MIGKTLAHYEITSQIGKGGMGEVYQAKDTKLGRDVAIKVLPEEFALDPDRVARFQREAKLLASLNHPNIAAIYGLEKSDDTHFLVMELIPGDTLADRLKRGPIPVEEALKLALQIAEALEAAHENGVIHRDLKPANIKVTPDSKVKVLDFGLAKAFAGDETNINLTDSPTLSEAATRQGIILGTAAYMSPEQARGKSVDKKADIWAFGVVLYEMLAGKALFAGEDITSTLARVLEREPDFSALPENIHFRIRFLLERCLKKDPKDRYSSISDARVDIQDVIADPSGVYLQPAAEAEHQAKPRSLFIWIATVIVASLIAGLATWRLKPSEPLLVTRFDLKMSGSRDLMMPAFPILAVSPDGRQLVYNSSDGLYLRSMDSMESRFLANADEIAITPTFSPDGQWIGYFSLSKRKIKKISINGGTPIVIHDATFCLGMSWESDNSIVYSTPQDGILRIPVKGGQPEKLIDREESEYYHPRLLPDGKSLLFTMRGASEEYQVAVQSLETEERKVLFTGDCAWYLPTRHLVYASENNLYAVPFNPDRLETEGLPEQVLAGVFRSMSSSAPGYAVSKSGTLVYVPEGPTAETAARRILVWMDSKGEETPVPIPPDAYGFPNLSPDGNKAVLVSSEGPNTLLWIWDFIRENRTPLITGASNCLFPIWTPDGKGIVFFSIDEPNPGILYKAADGTGKVETIASVTDSVIIPSSWSEDDGQNLVFSEMKAGSPIAVVETITGSLALAGGRNISSILFNSDIVRDMQANISDIGMLPIKDGKETIGLLEGSYFEVFPQVSPDGKWIAYNSDESGEVDVYVRPFPDVEKGRRKISTGGGASEPIWSPDGQSLFYRVGNSMMVVNVGTDPIYDAEKPKVLFQSEGLPEGPSLINYMDIHPDGNRFLMLKTLESAEQETTEDYARKINIVLNWFEELKQRVPVD